MLHTPGAMLHCRRLYVPAKRHTSYTAIGIVKITKMPPMNHAAMQRGRQRMHYQSCGVSTCCCPLRSPTSCLLTSYPGSQLVTAYCIASECSMLSMPSIEHLDSVG